MAISIITLHKKQKQYLRYIFNGSYPGANPLELKKSQDEWRSIPI